MYKRLKMGKTNVEIAKEIIERFKDIGLNTDDIVSDNIQRYLGEEMVEDASHSRDQIIACYLNRLLAAGMGDKSVEMPKECKKQIKQAYKDGLLSVYTSVLTCILGKMLDKDSKYKLVLGYLDTTYSFDELNSLQRYIQIPPIDIIKFHAVAVVNNKIIDVCYYMENEGKDQVDFIVHGGFPRGAAMYGWEMESAIAFFIDYFAYTAKMEIADFISIHIDALKAHMDNFYLN
ncbi:MAG: hypothetical protein H9893_01880 [Candidatus Niameybacter stercoravium]|nr:hypothetical protein [Candidatus Niameybacter stercoravium]